MNPTEAYSTWIEVNLGAIRNNLRLIQSRSNTPVMAIVKANGYGHGAAPVARAALQAGAVGCGVARWEEASELRASGLDCFLLMLGHTPVGQMEAAIAARVSMTVWTGEQIEAASAAAIRCGMEAHLHLKVDTGMGRIGAAPAEALALAQKIVSSPGIMLEGMFTHFARSDEADPAYTYLQTERFQEVLQQLTSHGLRPRLVHAANSAASLNLPATHFDMRRTGIALYGLHPAPDCPLPAGFQPALAWKAVLTHAKTLPAGSGISYNHEYFTSGSESIGTIPVGYADGFRRKQPNEVLVGGQRVPVVGRVCMDQAMLRLDSPAKTGDEVVLIGSQGGETIRAEAVAQRWKTNNYEVVTNISRRVPRVYLDGE